MWGFSICCKHLHWPFSSKLNSNIILYKLYILIERKVTLTTHLSSDSEIFKTNIYKIECQYKRDSWQKKWHWRTVSSCSFAFHCYHHSTNHPYSFFTASRGVRKQRIIIF
jgi:hypothetical protein